MSGIVVYNEAVKPLTRKRVFEVKLKDVALSAMYQDALDNLELLIEAEIFVRTGQQELETRHHTYLVFLNSEAQPVLVSLDVGRRFTFDEDMHCVWKVM